jgi:hypothetical protein
VTQSSRWFDADGEPGHWAARLASQNIAHRCRHCDERILDQQHYLVETDRPWLVLHFDCILRLGRDVVRASAAFDRRLEENDDEMTAELLTDWLVLTEFSNALRAYQAEIESRRASLELFIQGHRPPLMPRLKPRVKRRPPRGRRRG